MKTFRTSLAAALVCGLTGMTATAEAGWFSGYPLYSAPAATYAPAYYGSSFPTWSGPHWLPRYPAYGFPGGYGGSYGLLSAPMWQTVPPPMNSPGYSVPAQPPAAHPRTVPRSPAFFSVPDPIPAGSSSGNPVSQPASPKSPPAANPESKPELESPFYP